MHSATHRAIQDFDNRHEFERLAADVLNALGFSDVEPIAPRGGAGGGKDIKFREGELAGGAFVTLTRGFTTSLPPTLPNSTRVRERSHFSVMWMSR